MMEKMHEIASIASDIFLVLFGSAILLALITIIVLYIYDRNQNKHTVMRNFPVIGRLRYRFEHIGEFFRQYFFAMDREELPFNRAQRSWAYRAAKNVETTVAFGSTRSMLSPGDMLFSNSTFPTLPEQYQENHTICFGEHYVKTPYTTNSIINISAMSYGALSKNAIEALCLGAKKAGIWMNTGEGGLSPFHQKTDCDLIFQIGTAKYGVRDENGQLSEKRLIELSEIQQVKMFELKLSQGAKPGKGGMLPAAKVSAEIAKIRHIPIHTDSISPNRHTDIANTDELLEKIHFIRKTTNKPVGIKFVLGDKKWLDDLFETINQKGLDYAPDFITLDGGDGGTGAAPQPLMDYMGLPLDVSLPILIDQLITYRLRDRIKVIASGKLINPSKVVWALCVGADAINTARGFMFSLGCIQAMQCHKNTCPTGITTSDEKLQRGLVVEDKAERVYSYAKNMNKEINMMAHSCGLTQPREFRRAHCVIIDSNGKAKNLDELYSMK
ncbi:FMN-binding glutamate synthase family protein [Marinicellulosiphila megalodicopiae]|uniref:FMN-binding glutamate synthase family protein n=1 Tax=Marinicellulosiphila megalodicopiae TaxID=2724896 RepID=UPI003BB04414